MTERRRSDYEESAHLVRLGVLILFTRYHHPPTAKEVHYVICNHASLATVYRHLAIEAEKGNVVAFPPRPRKAGQMGRPARTYVPCPDMISNPETRRKAFWWITLAGG